MAKIYSIKEQDGENGMQKIITVDFFTRLLLIIFLGICGFFFAQQLKKIILFLFIAILYGCQKDSIKSEKSVVQLATSEEVKNRTELDNYIIKKFKMEEHTSELQSLSDLVCRLLLEKKKKEYIHPNNE